MPLFRALGYSIHDDTSGKPWLWFQTSTGSIQGFRPAQLASADSLAVIHPDLAHWRSLYPMRKDGSALNVETAREDLVAQAFAAGPYDPPEHLKPRGRGRPRKGASK